MLSVPAGAAASGGSHSGGGGAALSVDGNHMMSLQPAMLEDADFPLILSLAEALASSEEQRVREFVGTLYAVLYKVYCEPTRRERILRGLVARTTGSPRGAPEGELGLDILSFLVSSIRFT